MRRVQFSIALTLILCAPQLFANDCERVSANDYAVLRTARAVQMTSVGTAGEMPDAVRAVICILRREDGPSVFRQLLKESTLPGQMFALTGLYLSDQKSFNDLVTPYRRDHTSIRFLGGIAGSITVSRFVDTIIDGRYSNRYRYWIDRELPPSPFMQQ